MSIKRPLIDGKNFFIYDDCLEAEKGVFIKFYNPESISLQSSKDNYCEVEVRITREDWQAFQEKIKKLGKNSNDS